MDKLKLAMNVTSLLSPATGIASYTRNLAEMLLRSGEVEAYFFCLGWSRSMRVRAMRGLAPLKKLIVKLIPFPYEISRYYQQSTFNDGIKRYRPEVYHDPNYLAYRFDGPIVVTVHDLSHVRYPETHPKIRVEAMNKYLPRTIERADEIIVDSMFVKNEVVSHFGIDAAKVNAIHLGVSGSYAPRSSNEIAPILARFGLRAKRYILSVGTLEPRKNLIRTLEAYAALPARTKREMPLVIAGMKGWLAEELEEKIRRYEERHEVRWLGYVPARFLPMLYSGAKLFVYPSLYEGFGLPVLEAMASGVPVVTSNQASLPEVAGEAAITVEPHDCDAVRDAMRRLIEDEQEAERRADLGLAQAARFTWGACAQKTLDVYRKALTG